MSRLIDADELEMVMTEDWFLENLAAQDSKSAIRKNIRNMIDSVPLAYEKANDIKVGDVVTVDNGDIKFICTKDNSNGDYTKCHLMASDGSVWEECKKKGLKKTVKHIDIQSVLQQIGGDLVD